VFVVGQPFALQFYLNKFVFINHSWQQKTGDNGLPEGENCIALRFLVLTKYRSVTDGQTDKRTDGYAVALTALAKLALRRAVKRSPVRV